jgi:hypothetical protein
MLCMIERRKHRRIVTLKNFAGLILVLAVALAAANFISEHRAPRTNDYGRLSRRELPHAPNVSTPAPEVVQEAPVAESSPPPEAPTTLVEPPMTPIPIATQPPGNPATTATGNPTQVAIVGDERGVSIITPKHKLRGGFDRH